jgi:ABC-type phosphate/phosphonate transport system substrate-binding protein
MSAGAPVAALPMYDFPEIAAANEAFWRSIARRLRAQGLEAPERLERGRSLAALWRDSQLLFAQACGYPYAKGLSDTVVLIATPQYAFSGCDGASHLSFIVSRADDPRRSLEAFRGSVAAVNGFDSNSGMNLFRATIAQVARGATFFGAVVTTGSHVASLEAVAKSRADLAAVDCVTFGLAKRLKPRLVEPVRIVAESPLSPGLPFIASARLPDTTVAAVRNALASAMADGKLAETLRTLGLVGLDVTAPADYERVLEIERAAEAAGYPELA